MKNEIVENNPPAIPVASRYEGASKYRAPKTAEEIRLIFFFFAHFFRLNAIPKRILIVVD